jgi:hypothetical protein
VTARFIVGIDPGTNTGFAVFRSGKLLSLQTIHPLDIASTIAQLSPDRVIFEDSRLTSHLFTTNKNPAVAKSMARKVGQIDAYCGLITAACERLEIPAHGISPRQKGKKVKAEQFAALTGWDKPSNEHSRDAAMCAWPYRGAA